MYPTFTFDCMSNTLYDGWLVGLLYLPSHPQRGHLETSLPFTVPCEGREAQFLQRPHRESNPRLVARQCIAQPLRHASSTSILYEITLMRDANDTDTATVTQIKPPNKAP